MAGTTIRQTAEQRRETLLDAAMLEFGLTGLHGTSTDDIAGRAGISQPYLFRLFRTKRELFLASVERCFQRTEQVFRDAATGDTPEQRLESMGYAYCELLADRPKLMMQMQAYAACEDDDVRDTVRRCYEHLYRTVADLAGTSPESMRSWFSVGMFLNVMAAMDAPHIKRPWVRELMGELLLEKVAR
jgi:AcrR family transcriptional regulator